MAKTKVKKPREVEVYIDGTDWQYEVGEAADGNSVYPDVKSLQKYRSCWKGCGVVKCKLVFDSWIIEEDRKEMFKDSTKSYSSEEFEKNIDVIRFEGAQKHLGWLKEKIKEQESKIEFIKNKIENKEKK